MTAPTLPPGYTARPVALDDADEVAALIAACQLADGEPHSSATTAAEWRSDVACTDLNEETVVVLAPDGRIAGYVLALPYPMFRYPDLTRPERVAQHSANLHLHDLVISAPLRRRGPTECRTHDGRREVRWHEFPGEPRQRSAWLPPIGV